MPPLNPLPLALTLDLDNLWVYLKVHGDEAWRAAPTYLPRVVPRILEALRERELKCTFFLVGRDAEIPDNAPWLASIAEAGHEIANHSHLHDPWMGRYDAAKAEDEIARAEEAIQFATGRKTVGFRGPGFACSPTLLEILRHRGYQYDSSLFPTFAGPLARAFYFRTGEFTAEQRRERDALFGRWRDGFLPLRAFRWDWPAVHGMMELPVTTLPLARLPIHLSYIMGLAAKSAWAARRCARAALGLCRRMNVPPVLLLHPLEFLNAEEAPALRFFPGMSVPLETKQRLVGDVLDIARHDFAPMTAFEFAKTMAAMPGTRAHSSSLLD